MKQMTILGLLMAILAITSCNRDDLQYSCDPVINAWTKANIHEIQAMNRADFLNLDDANQRGAYRAMTSEQRIQIWIGKINQVLFLEWNERERVHIEKLRVFIDENAMLFGRDVYVEYQDIIELEAYKWGDFALNELGWTPELIYAIAGNPNDIIQLEQGKVGNVYLHSETIDGVVTKNVTPKTTCDCHWTESNMFMCSNSGENCIDREISGCEMTSFGCGLLWLAPCHGLCKK